MKRKDFLKSSLTAATVMPGLLDGYSVKALDKTTPWLTTLLGAADNDRILVLIQLFGGNDGLNTVIPLEFYSNYYNARSNVAIDENKILKLNGLPQSGLHPIMTGMRDLYNEGKVNIIQSVGYPQPNFSHFRATDIWMSGSDSNTYVNSGWAGRLLNFEYPNFPNGYPNSDMPDPLAIQIGSITSLSLQGPAVSMGMSISNPTNFYNFINGVQDPVPNTPAGKELSYVRLIAEKTQQYSSVIKDAANKVTQQVTYPTNSLADQLKIVARLIKGGLKTKVYVVSLGGFDTHSGQVVNGDTSTGVHATLLSRLSSSVKAFQDDLKFLNVEDRVLTMTFSEFGRRIKSNSSLGTDHGASAPLFLFGKHVVPGMLGKNPTIPANVSVNDNIPFQYDFRSVYASVLENWFCVKKADIQTVLLKNFQSLPIVKTSVCSTSSLQMTQQAGINYITNSPNPFPSSTTFKFRTNGGHTLVQIMDSSGRLIKTLLDADVEAGSYTLGFESGNLPLGVYYARYQNGAIQQVRPVIKAR